MFSRLVGVAGIRNRFECLGSNSTPIGQILVLKIPWFGLQISHHCVKLVCPIPVGGEWCIPLTSKQG